MSVQQMREYVVNAYPGKYWREKVEKMSDSQVIAIYYKILRENR